jgi:hypothetical protein
MGQLLLEQESLRQPTKRPTVMDRRFRGDPWVEGGEDGTLSLYLGNYPLAELRGLPLDLPHLNRVLERLRHAPLGRAGHLRSHGAG